MHDFWKKATVIGVATAALAVAGGAGAVAGDLIGTGDIKDNAVTAAKLDENSVRWGKHLNAKTKSKIESFAGEDGVDGLDGAMGPAGPEGPRGPAGPTGQTGAPGAAGGELYAWGAYGGAWGDGVVDGAPFRQVSPAGGSDIVINEPGVYLVSLRVLFPEASFGGFESIAVLGDFSAENELELLTSSGLCFGLIAPMCEINYPVFLEEGEQMPLPLYAGYEEECGDECAAPPIGQVSVFRMAGDAPDTSAYEALVDEYFADFDCEVDCDVPKDNLKRLHDYLEKRQG